MGYNTALSIGKALPDRINLVLSRRHEAPFPGQITVRSIEEAQRARRRHRPDGDRRRPGLFRGPAARTPHVPDLGQRGHRGADTFFPGVHFSDWTEVSRMHHKADAEHAYDFDMVEYIRSN